MRSTTGPALGVVLQSHHEQMPSRRLDRDEMEAVIDPILSLKTEKTALAGVDYGDRGGRCCGRCGWQETMTSTWP
jgi:hypothetical protein